MRGKLTIFQRTMIRWSAIHPYNGVHVARIPQAVDHKRLHDLIKQRLEDCGLTGLALDRKHRRFRYEGGPAVVEISSYQGYADPHATLAFVIAEALNAPFDRTDKLNPIRFFTINLEDSFYLGLVYDHFVSGGIPMVRLLKGIADDYTERVQADSPAPFHLYPPTGGSWLLRRPQHIARGFLAFANTMAVLRKSHRPFYADHRDCRSGFAYFRITPPLSRTLIHAAKTWGVTVHDLFLALLFVALATLTQGRLAAAKRKNLAIASIMDLRKEIGPESPEPFGPFFGAFVVSHPVPDGMRIRCLAEDVHRQTEAIKRGRLYFQTVIDLGLASVLFAFLSPGHRSTFYQKHYPVWAGVSNLNLNPLWEQPGGESAGFEYLRAAPTGPVAPVVFAITTSQDVMHVGVTYRTTVFAKTTIDQLIAAILRAIDGLEGERT
jgi:hypothetical protein